MEIMTFSALLIPSFINLSLTVVVSLLTDSFDSKMIFNSAFPLSFTNSTEIISFHAFNIDCNIKRSG